MMKRLFLWLALTGLTMTVAAKALTSPNGKITLEVINGKCLVKFQKQQVMELRLPVTAADLNRATAQRVTADYQMLAGKRLHCTNEANEYRMGTLVMRLYNDGLAFRYEYMGLQDTKAPEEQTAYIIPEGTRRWMQQWSDGYEDFFPLNTTNKVHKTGGFGGSRVLDQLNTRWGYPLLVEPRSGVFTLITEANIQRRQSASSLVNDGEVFRVQPDKNDLLLLGDWHTPWRVVIIGKLADIVESTLVTDVSEPTQLENLQWVKPGVVSWVYWAYNHGSNDFNIIKKYVDLAATLKLPYVLIDAEWDEMDKLASNEGKTIEDAVAYAKEKGVKPMIWYNSSVGWLDGAPGPKFRLNKPADREKEFAWCEKIGVAGVKVDFFSGDNQMNMDYCIDLMESAARHHLAINFHGASVPRGWQRTYPNLLSTEGVYGAEWYNNVPHFTAKAARHNATLPYTRNVIGPMDYTPCAFSDSQHPHITTHAHELALTVLFESGLQHLADRPESFLAQPQQVRDFLSQLPAAWDETRFISGYPGESAVLARRSGSTWYVAGINGRDEAQTLSVPLTFLKGNSTATLFLDSGQKEQPWDIKTANTLPTSINCQPRGGFVMVIR
ncbi:MAG: glycoside hydrolase family 97 catalytic domain-containing protein [Bacteroidaceae bacterium]|nr:glycoside hydrolase family 97 catalytic domain-containing protein [Bacteroidaceae bacterium]